jgi:hypothetical protein
MSILLKRCNLNTQCLRLRVTRRTKWIHMGQYNCDGDKYDLEAKALKAAHKLHKKRHKELGAC